MFVPEQVLLPGLHRQHWNRYGDGPSDLDHAFHEFVGLHDASEGDDVLLPPIGSTVEVVGLFLGARGKWDVRCSRYTALMCSGWIG